MEYHLESTSHEIHGDAGGVYSTMRGVPWCRLIPCASQSRLAQSLGGRKHFIACHVVE